MILDRVHVESNQIIKLSGCHANRCCPVVRRANRADKRIQTDNATLHLLLQTSSPACHHVCNKGRCVRWVGKDGARNLFQIVHQAWIIVLSDKRGSARSRRWQTDTAGPDAQRGYVGGSNAKRHRFRYADQDRIVTTRNRTIPVSGTWLIREGRWRIKIVDGGVRRGMYGLSERDLCGASSSITLPARGRSKKDATQPIVVKADDQQAQVTGTTLSSNALCDKS